MKVTLLKPIWEDKQGIHCAFEVRGDEREPCAEDVLFGSGNLTLHSNHSAEDIAEAVWLEAEAIRESGLALWELHNQVAPLLKAKEEQQ